MSHASENRMRNPRSEALKTTPSTPWYRIQHFENEIQV